MRRPGLLPAAVLLAAVLLTSCAAPGAGGPDDGGAAGTVQTPGSGPDAAPPAREGRVAPGRRETFVPVQVRLPGGDSAPVEPASTRDGVLEVPRRVDLVGWWDGSAHVGDPYGSTVLAGHVDSREQGLGFFAALLEVQVGQVVEVAGDGRTAAYRVTDVQDVRKEALASTGTALDQRGAHRLVLITCTGDFDPVLRRYDHNLVVTAVPAGAAG